jgi:Na+-translocating ferredoxin:NAD+ oxidoreductase RnfE subunit
MRVDVAFCQIVPNLFIYLINAFSQILFRLRGNLLCIIRLGCIIFGRIRLFLENSSLSVLDITSDIRMFIYLKNKV